MPRKEAKGTISSTRWVFDVKLGPDCRIDRFKARLVARGNEQSDNDFDETFAPVFQLDSLWILIAIAAHLAAATHVLRYAKSPIAYGLMLGAKRSKGLVRTRILRMLMRRRTGQPLASFSLSMARRSPERAESNRLLLRTRRRLNIWPYRRQPSRQLGLGISYML